MKGLATSRLERDVDITREAVRRIEDCLPKGWSIQIRQDPVEDLFGRVDAIVEVAPSKGRRITLLAEVRRIIPTRDLQSIVDRLDQAGRRSKTPTLPLVIARYLPPQSQAWLSERDIGYADATGNLRIVSELPLVFLRDVGAASDPWRGPGRPRGTLKGEPAARVVRALVDFKQPMTVPELITLSGASSGATYRVVEYLDEQAIIEREPRGPIETVDWRRLINAWSKDYGFMSSNSVRSLLQPRGLEAVVENLSKVRTRYALTGSLAARRWAPYAPARAAMIYGDDPDDIVTKLELREVETGANVLVAAPTYDVVFERTDNDDGRWLVAPSQAAVDLLSGPGRNPAEAEALLDWMEANVRTWRG